MSQFEELVKTIDASLVGIGFPSVMDIIWALIIIVAGHWLARRSRGWFRVAVEKTNVHSNKKLVRTGESLIYYGILILAVSLSLVALGLPLYSLVSIFALIIIVIAIALQTSLNNFAATIIFLTFQTFKPGDWIDVLDGTYGQVKEIQMFGTVIVTQERSTVTVPNGAVLTGNIVNYSDLGYRRVDIYVTITYQDDLLKAKRIMEQVIAENENVLSEPEAVVGVTFLGDKGVDFSLRPFAPVEKYWDTKFQITEQVKLRLNEAGITIPVIQQDVHVIQPS
ncbi:MAG: mechanosensitive ion channel family protein [Caldilineales bacterium]|nr:mechanosensitive ion channel family protein [Caldilineales bacterium]